MPLRTQITLLLAGALIFVGAGVVGLGAWQRSFDTDRFGNIAVALQRSLWDTLVAAKVADLNLVAAELEARVATQSPSLLRDEVHEVLDASPDLIADGITVEVVDLGGAVISANAPLFQSRPLIDRRILDRFRRGTRSVGGVRQNSPDEFVVAAMRPIQVQGEGVGAISVSVPADTLINALASDLHEPFFLLSPRGRLAFGTDPALWSKADLDLPRQVETARFITIDDRSYFVATIPVADLSGIGGGTLVAMRDVTAADTARRNAERLGLFAVITFALIVVASLYGLLRNAFSPLEGAVGALDALSKGDLARPIDAAGAGEIGRIAKAIGVFRRNTQRLIDQEEGIARQRRRQERVIRRELERLAELLDPEGRAEILADLAAVLPNDGSPISPQNAELATLAHLLSRMSQRIADQHTRLTGLIKELQDAIVTRTRLAALEQELDIARELQRTFLPQPLPPDPRFEVYGLMESAKEVGGDFFDVFMVDDQNVGIVVADVSGKGVPAALFMAITRTLIKATALNSPSPAATVTEVNRFLAGDNEQMMFVTLFHGLYNIDTGYFAYVNAGHNPPFLLAGGDAEMLPRVGGPALGVVEEAIYGEQALTLSPGTVLFAYTDGVTEAFNAKEEAFGEDRLEHALRTTPTRCAQSLCRTIRELVLTFEDGAVQADDVTCFALRRAEAPYTEPVKV